MYGRLGTVRVEVPPSGYMFRGIFVVLPIMAVAYAANVLRNTYAIDLLAKKNERLGQLRKGK